MDLVVFGQQNWDVCWTAKQHLATRLAARGHRVLYVDPTSRPAGGAALARALAPVRSRFGVREEGPNGLAVYTYRPPAALGQRAAFARRPRVLREMVRALGFAHPVVLTLHPRTVELLPLLEPAASAYYAVDEWTGFYEGQPAQARQIRALEERLLREVDVAIGVSQRLYERFAAVHPNAHLLPNGVDAAYFHPERLRNEPPHAGVAALPRPRLGLVGQVDQRVDQELLLALARRHPEWQIVLVGRVKEADVGELAAAPNVHLLGYQPFERLPGILRELDVCLVPYRLTPLTHSCSPLKAYEYLATGLPVVATPVDGLRPLQPLIRTATGAAEFERAVAAALADPRAGGEQRLAAAAEHSWERRTDALERLLLEAAEERSRHVARVRAARVEAARLHAEEPHTAARTGAPPLLDPKEDAEQRRRGFFADQTVSMRGRLLQRALRVAGRGYHWARMAARAARGERPVRVRRILVVRRGYLGDLVVFTPTLAALRARYPHARITLGVHARFSAGALLEDSPYVDEVRVLDFLQAPSTRERLRGALALFASGYDLVLFGVWYFLIREAFYAGAPYQIGLDDGHPLQAALDVRVPLQPYRHEAENNLAVVERLGAQPVGVERVPLLPLPSERALERADALLARLALPADVPFVAMHPGSKRPSRRWPAASFSELAAQLLAAHPTLRVVLTGSADEEALADEVRAAVPERLRHRVVSAAGRCDLADLVALLERAAVYVSNDTGVMHVARARGVPLVALLGPENDRRWGPHQYGPAPAISLREVVPCAPCPRHACERLYCMRSLPVADVRAAVERLLCAGPGRASTAEAAPGMTEAAAEPLVLLERRQRPRDWRALHADGFELPLVSVLLVAEPAADDGAAPARPAVGAALAALARQRYPRLEVVVVEDGSAAGARSEAATPGATPLERVVTVRPTASGAAAGWQAALRAARGEFVVPLSLRVAGALLATWDAERVGREVAALMRLPEAALTGGAVPLADAAEGHGRTASEGSTYRRALLEPTLAALAGARGDGGAGGGTGDGGDDGAVLLARARTALARQHPLAVAEPAPVLMA